MVLNFHVLLGQNYNFLPLKDMTATGILNLMLICETIIIIVITGTSPHDGSNDQLLRVLQWGKDRLPEKAIAEHPSSKHHKHGGEPA